ncbi:LysM peptidoglycan-binding domain-containing protein [Carnobacterium mobile]|uniref:LysM peptidoglycan-binding domain-containing protein n=1 Tax=Carnobacterium mobile TaxID=2750 RepID=UPI0005544BD1|nr:LysM peptidoglycan-binding domain-containing protein [Carnobacterium mobile]
MAGKKSKKNQNDEIWSRKFDNDDGLESDNQSRIARKKAKGGISPIVTSLFIFLALLIILPVATYLWYVNSGSQAEELKPDEEKITITQNSSTESSSEKNSSSSSSEKDTESSEESSVVEQPVESEPEEDIADVPVQTPPEEEPVESVQENEPETVPEETGGTYTVKAGDNLYRIALNHGMTTEELKTLNGISGDEVSVGTVLKVK